MSFHIGRVAWPIRFVFLVIIGPLILGAVISRPNADTVGQDESPGPPEIATRPDPQPMDFRPPPDADSLADFIPPGATIATAQTGARVSAESVLEPDRDNAILVDDGRAAFVIEAGTFDVTATLRIASVSVSTATITATNTVSNPVESQTLSRFQVEAIDADGNRLERFSKRVRIVLDLRDLAGARNPVYSDFFLAYRDESDPLVWHGVPTTVFQRRGLISADVAHFSEWKAGVKPERWSPQWTPPLSLLSAAPPLMLIPLKSLLAATGCNLPFPSLTTAEHWTAVSVTWTRAPWPTAGRWRRSR